MDIVSLLQKLRFPKTYYSVITLLLAPLVGEIFKKSSLLDEIIEEAIRATDSILFELILKAIKAYMGFEMPVWGIFLLIFLFLIVTGVKFSEGKKKRVITQISKIEGDNNFVIQYSTNRGSSKEEKIDFEVLLQGIYKIFEKKLRKFKRKLKEKEKKEGLLNQSVIELSTEINSLRDDFKSIDERAIKFLDDFQGKKLKGYDELYLSALSAFLHGKPDGAIKILDEPEIDNISDLKQRRQTRILKSRLLQFVHNHDLAQYYYNKALNEGVQDVNFTLEYAYYLQSRNKSIQSEELYKACIKLTNNQEKLGIAHNNLGVLYRNSHQFQKSEHHFIKALTIRERLAEDKSNWSIVLLTNTLESFAGLLSLIDKFNLAREYLERAISLTRELVNEDTKFLKDLSSKIHNYSVLMSRKKMHHEIIKRYDEVLLQMPKPENDSSESNYEIWSKFLLNLGMQYRLLGDVSNSEMNLSRSLRYAKILSKTNLYAHSGILALVHLELAMLFKYQDNEKSKENFIASLDLNRKFCRREVNSDLFSLSNILNKFGTFMIETGEDFEGKKLLDEAIEITKTLAKESPSIYLDSFAQSLEGLGAYLAKKSLFRNAIDLFEKSLEIYEFLSVSNPEKFNLEFCRVAANLCEINKHILQEKQDETVKEFTKDYLIIIEDKLKNYNNKNIGVIDVKNHLKELKDFFK